MFDFILQDGRAHEQAFTRTVERAVGEISTAFAEPWAKVEGSKRCQETIAVPLQEALAHREKPRLLLTLAKQKDGLEEEELDGEIDAKDKLHFVQLGDLVFMIMARDLGNRKTALQLYPPLDLQTFEKKKDRIEKDGLKGLFGKPRSDLDVIKLTRDRPPTTAVQFNDLKVNEDSDYGWALWEAAASVLRRARATAFREAGLTDAIEPSKKLARPLVRGPITTFKDALPFLIQKKGLIEHDGPPRGHHILHAFSWIVDGRALPVVVTREEGPTGRIFAFVRDRVGDRPAWFELPFPAGAKIPAAGVAATLEGDLLRIFGGVDANKRALDGEWFYDLSSGRPGAYTAETFRLGQNLPDTRAWAAAIAADSGTLIAGGIAGFVTQKGQKEKFAARVRDAIEQVRLRGVGWASREVVPRELAGAHVLVENDFAYVGPGGAVDESGKVIGGFDGLVDLYDAKIGKWTPLADLPAALGLGQLHRSGNLLFYSAGFEQKKDGTLIASGRIFALDLEQLDGWKEIGESPFTKGTIRSVLRDDTLVCMGLTPKGRVTFVPGIFPEKDVEEES
jgi:hypothetical protein